MSSSASINSYGDFCAICETYSKSSINCFKVDAFFFLTSASKSAPTNPCVIFDKIFNNFKFSFFVTPLIAKAPKYFGLISLLNKVDFVDDTILIKPIDYYYTNPIARSSKIMSECRQISKKLLFTGIEKAS